MPKCPYCFEEVPEKTLQCPHCIQFIIDDLVRVNYPGVDTKKCIFCGKKILTEAKICRYCHKWLDELDQAMDSQE